MKEEETLNLKNWISYPFLFLFSVFFFFVFSFAFYFMFLFIFFVIVSFLGQAHCSERPLWV